MVGEDRQHPFRVQLLINKFFYFGNDLVYLLFKQGEEDIVLVIEIEVDGAVGNPFLAISAIHALKKPLLAKTLIAALMIFLCLSADLMVCIVSGV